MSTKKASSKPVPKKPAPAKAVRAKRPVAVKAVKPKKSAPVAQKQEKPAKKAPAKKETALAIVNPAKIVPIQKDEPAENTLDASFKKQAEALDAKIRKTVERVGRDMVSIGEMCLEMKDKAYYAVLGYKTAQDYFKAVLPEMGKSQIYLSMKVVRDLTQGDAPSVSKEDARQMTQENLESLADLKAQNVPLTEKIIEDAKSMSGRKFKEEVVHPAAPALAQRSAAREGKTLASAPQVMVRETHEWPSDLAALKHRALQIGRWLSRDDEPVKQDEKAWEAIFGEFIATYESQFEEAMAAQEAQAGQTARDSTARGVHDASLVEEEILQEDFNVISDDDEEAGHDVAMVQEQEEAAERTIEADEYVEA